MKKLRPFIAPLAIAALILFILRRSLFSGGQIVPGMADSDLHLQFLGWRYFAFTQWTHGHFPFWNPHVFCGIPFFAQTQSELLYPLTWIHFLLSTATAANIEIAANLFAAALCMYCWARKRQLTPPAAALAGIVYTFSAPVFLRVMAGHLSPLASLAWMPLEFIGIDQILAQRFLFGILIGAAAICLQFFGGSPQYAYYTMLVGFAYLILQSIARPGALRHLAAFIAMYLLGAMLAAAQLLPSYLASQLSIRSGGTSYIFAGMVSLSPESLLSIFIPYPFGDVTNMPYVGRWYLWEMSAYAGIVPLLLACIGLAGLKRSSRWRMTALLAAILLLMLGSYTPIYRLLYDFVPGFALFRGSAKFASLWVLFLAILAGHGWDKIHQGKIPRKTFLLTAAATAMCVLLAAIVYQFNTPDGLLGELIRLIYRSGQFYINKLAFLRPDLLQSMTQWVGRQWCIAAAFLAVTCILLLWRRVSIRPAYLLLILAIADVYLAALSSNLSSPLSTNFPKPWMQPVIDASNQNQRVLFSDYLTYGNNGNLIGYDSLWGYDPGQPKRYTQLIAASQNQHPPSADQYNFDLQRTSRVFHLLRCRYILRRNAAQPVLELRNPMPHLTLIGSCIRMTDPTQIADRLATDFDFRQSVILDQNPNPAPTPTGAAGHVNLLHDSINDLQIQADLPAPALLLITDAFAPGWRVRPLEPNPSQPTYQVLRADDVLRAIPLAAGHHHFDLYYFPPGLTAGITLSAIGFILWLTALTWQIKHTNNSRLACAPAQSSQTQPPHRS